MKFQRALAFVLGALLGAVPVLADFQRFGAGGTSTIINGSTSCSGCTAGGVLHVAAGVVTTDADFIYASDVLTLGAAGAGTNATVWTKTMSGSSATSNFFSVTGTMPSTGSAVMHAVKFDITTAGSHTNTMRGLSVELLAGNTGNAYAFAGSFLNRKGTASLISAGTWTGALGNGTVNVGSYSFATGATTNVGLFAGLGDLENSPVAPSVSAAAIFDNRAVAADIFIARDNGTPVFTIADGGASTFTQSVSFPASNVAAAFFPVDGAIAFGGSVGTPTADLRISSTLTPDSLRLGVNALSNAFHVYEYADAAFDFANGGCGTAACTDPNLTVRSTNQATDQYSGLTSAGIYGRWGRALSEGSATSVAQVKFTGNDINSGGYVCYTVQAADGTDRQVRAEGCMSFAVRQSGATETCTVGPFRTGTAGTVDQTTDGNLASISAGTLTYTVTCDTTPTNGVNFQINATSSLTQTSLFADGTVMLHGPGQIIRQ